MWRGFGAARRSDIVYYIYIFDFMTTTVNTEPLFFGSFILFYDTRVARAVTRHTHTLRRVRERGPPRRRDAHPNLR